MSGQRRPVYTVHPNLKHYKDLQHRDDYWQCRNCGAINHQSHPSCPDCGYSQPSAHSTSTLNPPQNPPVQRRHVEAHASTGDSQRRGLPSKILRGAAYRFARLPRRWQFIFFAVTMFLPAVWVPWGRLGLAFVQLGLVLGGAFFLVAGLTGKLTGGGSGD